MVDLKHTKCPCGKQPFFGIPNGKAECCAGCRLAGMVDVKTTKCPCGKQPVFGIPGGKAECCAGCRLAGMVDLKNTKCPCGGCGFAFDPRSILQDLCYTCRLQRPRAERAMRAFLVKKFPNARWVFDKSNPGIVECADRRYRPDAWLELPGHVVAVECEEEQHRHYGSTCELKRVNEVLVACGGKPLVLIRWNPDGFEVGGAAQEVSLQRRLSALGKRVTAALLEQPESLLHVEYMYYDGVREAGLHTRLASALHAYL